MWIAASIATILLSFLWYVLAVGHPYCSVEESLMQKQRCQVWKWPKASNSPLLCNALNLVHAAQRWLYYNPITRYWYYLRSHQHSPPASVPCLLSLSTLEVTLPSNGLTLILSVCTKDPLIHIPAILNKLVISLCTQELLVVSFQPSEQGKTVRSKHQTVTLFLIHL